MASSLTKSDIQSAVEAGVLRALRRWWPERNVQPPAPESPLEPSQAQRLVNALVPVFVARDGGETGPILATARGLVGWPGLVAEVTALAAEMRIQATPAQLDGVASLVWGLAMRQAQPDRMPDVRYGW